MIILAFDSGLERTGYAFFEKTEGEPALLAYGCIKTPAKKTLQERIFMIHTEVSEMCKEYKPDVFVLERLFFTKNQTTGIPVAQAQGAVLMYAGEHNIEVDFLTPSQIKTAVTGDGNADKKAMEKMVMLLTGLQEKPKPDDTIDAIACGLTYCTMRSIHDRQNLR